MLQDLTLFLLAVILCCCIDERDKYEVPTFGQEKAVIFSVKVPGTGIPKTYALTENNENEVKQIVVLLFDDSGNYIHYPIYSNNIITDPGDNTQKTFTVKVPQGTYDMIILANANTSLGAALSSINTGDAKSIVLKKLLLTNPHKWDTNASSGNYKPIPMWGEIVGLSISSNMPANIPINLSRMVAKIDVALTTTAAKNSFNLKSIRLYNYNDQGQVVPEAINWNSTSNIAVAPSIPLTANKLGNPSANPSSPPLLYDESTISKDTEEPARGISSSNEIYTFEANAGSLSSHFTNTCLVIGGSYMNDNQDSYYRIDFANTNGTTTTYLPLLRNHQYKININQISGPGLATPEDAFNARPVNIKASIVQWSDGRFTDFAVNDQYLIGVSQKEFIFSREERNANSNDNTLSIITDYPSGWKIDKIVDTDGNPAGASWLTCNPTSGSNPNGNDVKLRIPTNNSNSTRTAFIHIKAERLVYIIKVTQLITANIGISITNTDGQEINKLEFASRPQDITANAQPALQQFNVSWAPTASNLFFNTNTLGSNAFSFASGNGLDVIPGNGSLAGSLSPKTYTIRPSAITTANLNSDPFFERSSILLYQVSDGIGNTATKTLTLRHYAYNMVPVVDPIYLMDGGTKVFTVRSNSPFTVEIDNSTNTDGVIVSKLVTSGLPDISDKGMPVYFNIINDMTTNSLSQRTVKIIIKSPTGLFPDTDINLNCISGIIQPKSNSYIVAPNSIPILIPVARANESILGNQLGTNETFTADLVWTDNSNRIAPNSNIKMINTVGRGANGYLFIMPGSDSGNAVVCIKNSSNKILWSWHIWVTSYIPPSSASSGTFMNRNLGAIGNTPGGVSIKGLLYQWGRKDAFPGSSSLSANEELPIYNSAGSTTILKANTPSSSPPAYNIRSTIENPNTFYTSNGSSGYDWYNNTNIHRDDLWGHNTTKSVYDPCPNGWRIPQNGAWGTTNIIMGTNGTSWSNYGMNRSNGKEFYPASGYRDVMNGSLMSVGISGYYWSRTPSNNSSYSLFFINGPISPNSSSGRGNGSSVRCVKE